jgi:hypothetical protein
MAIDVFNEERIESAVALSEIRYHLAQWGRALVRTDISDSELSFLARSFRSSVTRERAARERATSAVSVVRALSRR